jgi:hypothetical protein
MAYPGRRRRCRYAFTLGRSYSKPRLPPRFIKIKHAPPIWLRPVDTGKAAKLIFSAAFSLGYTWLPGLALCSRTGDGPRPYCHGQSPLRHRRLRPGSAKAPSGCPERPYLPHALSKKRAIRDALSLDGHVARVRLPSLRGDPATFTRQPGRLSPLGWRDHRPHDEQVYRLGRSRGTTRGRTRGG